MATISKLHCAHPSEKLSFLASEDEQFLLLLTKVLDKVKRDLEIVDLDSLKETLDYFPRIINLIL